MKLVREHIFEKFIDDSDPIEDMNIGLKPIIEKWIKENVIIFPVYPQRHPNAAGVPNRKAFTINKNYTININHNCRINSDLKTNLPDYIQFNIIRGNFSIDMNANITSLRGCPKLVKGDFQCSRTSIKNLIGGPKDVKGKYICSVIPTLESLEGFPKHIGEYVACNNKAGLTMKDVPKGSHIENLIYSNIEKWSDW